MADRKRAKAAKAAGVAPRIAKVAREDFQSVKPGKIVPGIVGRSEWFAERAGRKADALTLRRLEEATAQAQTTSVGDVRIEAATEALESLSRMKTRGARVMAFGAEISEAPATKGKRDAFAIGPAIELKKVGGNHGSVVIPIDPDIEEEFDLEDVFVADLTDKRRPQINDTFTHSAEANGLVGRIYKAGVYQAYAMPRNPWLRTALETVALHWRWLQHDPLFDKARAPKKLKGLIDRICQVILCAPEYADVRDPAIFEKMGVGLPPGSRGGRLDPKEFRNVCERCLGTMFGTLTVVEGVVIAPPIITWIVISKRRCSKWTSAGPFPGAGFGGIGRVSQISVHPTNGDVVIAGAAGGGVWRTDNAGVTWRPLMELQPTLTIGAVAFAPSNGSVMYAASGEDGGGWNPAWSGVGVYRSRNGGALWELTTSLPSTRFSAIVVHPKDPDVLYVAGNYGLHKSVDGGTTWLTNPGLGSLFDAHITDIVMAHDDPDRLYIGVANSGVWKSIDGGFSFTRLDGADQLPSGVDAGWTKLTIGRGGANGSNFLAAKLGPNGSRIFRTTDGGTMWKELAANVQTASYDEWCSLIAVDPTNEKRLFAGAVGISRTTNGGAAPGDWTGIGGVHGDQQDMAFDPKNAQRIYLGNDGGVYRSVDGGATWTFASGSMAITQLYDVDISERNANVLAGGAQDNGIYYRNAAGTWIHIPWGDGTQVAIDPTDPAIFYFSSQNGLPNWLRRSVDGGATHQPLGTTGLTGSSPWVTIMKLDPTDPIASPATNRIVFVCGHNTLFRSTNGGSTWQQVQDGMGAPFTTFGSISALELAPSDPSILYLGTTSGAVYRATGGGITTADWTRIDTPGSEADALFPNVQVQAIGVSPFDPNDVWVVFGGSGVSAAGRPDMILNPLGISHLFRTTDGGTNWIDASGRFAALNLPDVPTSAVAISDINSEQAYVGTDVGVFRTVDGGTSWTAYQDGLPRVPVVELKFNRPINRLVAGTMGRGIFTREV